MKLIFFDIDGTLVPIGQNILESSRKAIKQTQQKGNKVFLATGRSKCQVSPELFSEGFDGYLCATGEYVEYNNEVVFHDAFSPDEIKQIVGILTKGKACFLEQCCDCVYLQKSSLIGISDNVGGKGEKRPTFEEALNCKHIWGNFKFDDDTDNYHLNHKYPESFCFCESNITRQEIAEMLPDSAKVLPPSFMPTDDYSGEIMLKRTSKMKGILKIADKLNVPVRHIYAFGDGDNDLEMIKGCGCGIAMGNATQACKDVADYITDDQYNDGIYNAMKKFELI